MDLSTRCIKAVVCTGLSHEQRSVIDNRSRIAWTFNKVHTGSGMKHRAIAQAAIGYRQLCLQRRTLQRPGVWCARHGETIVVWYWIGLKSCVDLQQGAQGQWYEAQGYRTSGDRLSTTVLQRPGVWCARHGETVVVWYWIGLKSCVDLQQGAQGQWYEAQGYRTSGDRLSTTVLQRPSVWCARHGETVVVWYWIGLKSCVDLQQGAQGQWYEAQGYRTSGDSLAWTFNKVHKGSGMKHRAIAQAAIGYRQPYLHRWTMQRPGVWLARHGDTVVVWYKIGLKCCVDL
ncbi:unnamed protein product [Closterium sp. Yama58-4]|nr:unnamed protein product [Closterium sp. Yama58-4]